MNWSFENKYKNKKIIIDGIEFDSEKESNRYSELKILERAGIIKDLRLQVKFELQPPYNKNSKRIRGIYYIADFVYIEDGKTIIEDTKRI